MEIINDLNDLKKYMKVDKGKKEILLKFGEVVFNCALPSKYNFNYFLDQSIKGYDVTIRADKITFNYYAECDNIYARTLVTNDTLYCKFLNVQGKTVGGYIKAEMFIGIDVEVNTFVVKKICSKKIKIAFLSIDGENYHYIESDSVNNIGVD